MPNAKKPAEPKPPAPKAEPKAETKAKPRRPRIDAIINAILKGEYDDQLGNLRTAIDRRNEARRADVLALVHEVYGENVSITATRARGAQPFSFDTESSEANLDQLEQQAVRRNPFTEKAESQAEDSGPTPETPAVVVRQPQAAGDDPMQEDSDGYVSRSPVIG
jgi:hypothetical protein